MGKISVVVCVYNRASFIEKCIDSVLRQDIDNYEVIIIDDGSTDSTPHVIKKFSADPRIRIYQNERNLGLLKSRNVGADKADGEIVAYTDSDCIVEKDWLRLLTAPFKKDPSIAISGGRILDGFKEGYWGMVCKGICKITSGNGYVDRIFGGNMAFRKAFLSGNRFDELFTYYADEADLCRRAHKAGFKVYFTGYARVTHFHRNTLRGMVKQRILIGVDNFLFRMKYRMIPPVSLKSLFLLFAVLTLLIQPFRHDGGLLALCMLLFLGYIAIVFYEDARTAEKNMFELIASIPGRLIMATCESIGYFIGIARYLGGKRPKYLG